MEPFNWTCPHCGKPQIVSDKNSHIDDVALYAGDNIHGLVSLQFCAISCLADDCRKLALMVWLNGRGPSGNLLPGKIINYWTLLPEAKVKPQPEYISQALRSDYIEACRIRDLSPKASATLARRCLQGMIRDFAGISKATLDAEIKELHHQVENGTAAKGVTTESVEAIDRVRTIGNIGAHMEKDVSLIIEIESDEAQLLIELIEMLFEEWYVERHNRALRLARVAALSDEKKAARKAKDA